MRKAAGLVIKASFYISVVYYEDSVALRDDYSKNETVKYAQKTGFSMVKIEMEFRHFDENNFES